MNLPRITRERTKEYQGIVDHQTDEFERRRAKRLPGYNSVLLDAWLCDKGRFAFSFVDQPTRLTTPLLRERGLEPVSFTEALTAVAGWCRGRRAAVLAGGRLSDEDGFALSKLARTVLKTNDVDHRVAGGDPGAVVLRVAG